MVYVDNNPAVLAHGAALLSNDDLSHVTGADIFQPEQVLGDKTVRSNLDFSKPLALLQVGTLNHHVADDGAESMRHYIDALPSGSFVLVSHFSDPETDELSPLARRMEEVFLHSPMRSGVFRTRTQITEFLPSLDIVPPRPDRAANS